MQQRITTGAFPPRNTNRLMNVALGREEADLVIANARLLNVYTGEVLANRSVCVSGEWIAYVGEDVSHSVGPSTHMVDAAGGVVIPGLIDGHTHLAWLCRIDHYLRHMIPGGTTTLITESMEVFPVAGKEGVVDFLDSLARQPVRIFATAPFMASTSKKARGIDSDTLRELLSREDIIGLGESYWQALLQEPERMLPALEATRRSGKSLEGHTAGASARKLQAYLTAGITSCHEPIKVDEVLERVRLGLYVMIREGSIRRDLEDIAAIRDRGIDTRRLILVSDGITPADLLEKGGMDYIVQKAIDCGFEPACAIQMATLNVAEHFGLDGILGGIAPGRCADMLIIPELETIQPNKVISRGRVVAENGRLLAEPRVHQFRPESRGTVTLPGKMHPEDFAVRSHRENGTAAVRVIEMVTDLVTREHHATLPVTNGRLQADPEKDILKVAAVDRALVPGKMFTGLIKGFGLTSGALACSAAWDTSDIVVAGADDADMARAVNRIEELQGGAVYCENGRIVTEVALPVFGLISEEPLEGVAEKIRALKAAVSRNGCPFPDPLLSLVALTGAAIPFLRICEEGLVHLKDGKTLGLFIE